MPEVNPDSDEEAEVGNGKARALVIQGFECLRQFPELAMHAFLDARMIYMLTAKKKSLIS